MSDLNPALFRKQKCAGTHVEEIRPKSRIAAALRHFSLIRQVAPICTAINTCFLGPARVHAPKGISISSAVFAQFTADGPYT